MDSIGRINTIKLACLPGVVGWCTIALAQNVPTIIVGRILLGASMGNSIFISTKFRNRNYLFICSYWVKSCYGLYNGNF